MQQKVLDRLNSAFGSFGYNPHGGLNFKWCRASDVFYLYETGEMEESRTPSGIYFQRMRYEKHPFARLYGDAWFLAMWQGPNMDETRWKDKYGAAFPWPKHGQYFPIESTVLPAGKEPDEKLTQYTVFKLRRHLDMKYGDHLANAQVRANEQQKEEKRVWGDVVDNTMPAFGNIPGQKLHVSFPSPSTAQASG